MDRDGDVERALRDVLGRDGPSLLADNDALGRQLRFELGDASFDHETEVGALLRVLRSGALRDVEVGDLSGAYRTATAADPGIAHEAADWAIGVLDRVTSGRSWSAATPTRPVAPAVPLTQRVPAQRTSTRATATMSALLAEEPRHRWPRAAKILVSLLTVLLLGAAATAGFLALEDRDEGGSAATVLVTTSPATSATTIPAITAPATTVPPTTVPATTVPATTVPPTVPPTTAPPVVAVDQIKAAGPLGTYALEALTASCSGLGGCETFPNTVTAAATDAARTITAQGIFAIPVSFTGGIGPWTATGAGAAAGADCGSISAANWTITVDVTSAQLGPTPVAATLNYAFRAGSDPACPNRGTAEFTGILRRTG